MIRGKTKNVLITPKLNKDVDEKETFVPYHIDLRNGYLSDAGTWVKRWGSLQDSTTGWDLGLNRAVNCLIPKDSGYAVLDNNKIVSLAGTGTVLSPDVLTGPARPTWADFGGDIVVFNGGVAANIKNGTPEVLDGDPPPYHFVGRLAGYVLAAEKGGTKFQWCTENNHESWPSDNFANVKKEGTIRNMVIFHERAYFLKTGSIEVWALLGSLPFARIDALTIEKGCGASDSVVLNANNTIYWFGDDWDFYKLTSGTNYEVISRGYRGRINDLTNLENMYGFDFRKEHCIRWFAPTNRVCFKYDYKYNHFSEDNTWISGQWMNLPFASYMELANKQYAGSSNLDGLIYRIDENYLTDNGNPIRVFRDFNIKLTPNGTSARVNGFRWRGKRGVATSAITSPVFVYRYKFPGTGWSNNVSISLGAVGDDDPWIDDIGPKGVGREMQVQIWHTDATEFNLTDMQVISKTLGR